jgi:hypothetical protein
MGSGGTTIPLQSPGVNSCGAFVSSFFNGTLPSITETVFNATICFMIYSGEICDLVGRAAVVNCGSFYVYFLPPATICNSRYCTI